MSENGNGNAIVLPPEPCCSRCSYARPTSFEECCCRRYPTSTPKRSNDVCGEFNDVDGGTWNNNVREPGFCAPEAEPPPYCMGGK